VPFFEGQKRHFPLFGAGTSQLKPLVWLLLCRPTFLAPECEKNGGRHFSGEDFVDVMACYPRSASSEPCPKMAEMAVFRRAKAPFFPVWSRDFSTQAFDLAAFMSADFFGAREREKCRAPFSGEDFVDVKTAMSPKGKGREEPAHGSESSMAHYPYTSHPNYMPYFH
jgi:hypothetical protein